MNSGVFCIANHDVGEKVLVPFEIIELRKDYDGIRYRIESKMNFNDECMVEWVTDEDLRKWQQS